jgi:hypothetical protein
VEHVSYRPMNTKNFYLGHGGIFDLDLDHIDVAPWRKRGAVLDAYFNYDFTERSWRRYINDIRKARLELHLRNRIETASSDQFNVDSDLPVEVRRALGGWECAEEKLPYQVKSEALQKATPIPKPADRPIKFIDDETVETFMVVDPSLEDKTCSEMASLDDLREIAQRIQFEYCSLVSTNSLTHLKNFELQKQMLEVKNRIASHKI